MRRLAFPQPHISSPALQGFVVTLCLALGLTFAAGAQVATTTQLTVPVSTVGVGVPTLLTATVTDGVSHSVHLGTVTFYDGTRSLGEAQIVSGTSGAYPQGTANLKTASLLLGTNSIKAVFSGTKSDAASTSPVKTVTVTGKSLTTTALTGHAVGTDFYLTAALEAFGPGTPTGSVDFSHISNGIPIETIDTKSLSGATWSTDLSIKSSAIVPFDGLTESVEVGYDDVVATGDFNGDGFVDLAMNSGSGRDNNVNVFLGKGDGTFKAPVTHSIGGNPVSIYAADFNNDGRLDLAVVDEKGGAVGILAGNGDGTFQQPVEYGTEPGAEYAYVADLNRDGNLDIVLGGVKNNADTVAVLLGNGAGGFEMQGTYAVGSGGGPVQVTGGDLKGDGILDLVVATTEGESVLLGNGDGTFLQRTVYPLGSTVTNLITLADVNGDGKLDLVWSSFTSGNPIYGWTGTVGVSAGMGDGSFAKSRTYAIAGYPQKPVVADFNQDGKPDIVVGLEIVDSETEEGSNVQLLPGNGDGTFQAAATYLPTQPTGYLITGDFNGDGRPDLAGAGGFAPGADIMTALILNGQTTSVQVARDELGPGRTTVEASYGGDGAFAGNVSNAVKLSPNLTPPPTFPNGFNDIENLLFNGSALFSDVGTVFLENGEPNQAGSVYYAAPQNVQAFTTDFVYDLRLGSADGFTFVIQNAGPQAVGGIGGGLGYEDIPKSIAIKFDIFNNSGEGNDSTGLYIDGASPTVPAINIASSGGLELANGGQTPVHITYDGTTLTLAISDAFYGTTFSHSWPIDIPATVGGTTAYVGFTGATGGETSPEVILSWTYQPGVY